MSTSIVGAGEQIKKVIFDTDAGPDGTGEIVPSMTSGTPVLEIKHKKGIIKNLNVGVSGNANMYLCVKIDDKTIFDGKVSSSGAPPSHAPQNPDYGIVIEGDGTNYVRVCIKDVAFNDSVVVAIGNYSETEGGNCFYFYSVGLFE